jgi:hypothetical protein
LTSAPAQRARLGLLCAAFGALSLAPLGLSWLSAYGPSAFVLNGGTWSRLFFGQFIALVALGYGYILALAARNRVFHGGPMLDFTIGLGLLVIASSLGRAWIPGVWLLSFGLRLSTGRALLA